MNKLKDFIYDYTDLLLSLLVVLGIVFVIGTNFTIFDQNLSSFISSSNNKNASDNQSLIDEDQDDIEENNTNNYLEEDESSEDGEYESIDESETVTIQIPQGATAAQIGDELHTQKLVDSSAEFVEMTEDLNVSHRLRPGTFEIPKDATLREMIQILIQSSL